MQLLHRVAQGSGTGSLSGSRRKAEDSAGRIPLHIMTSCDGKLMKYLSVNLQEIHEAMPESTVRYYILHSGNSSGEVEDVKKKARGYRNIEVAGIEIPDDGIYEEMNHLCNPDGWWSKEAFYHLCAYRYLPGNIDRILYLDAGDIMVAGRIDDFYCSDFHGMPLIATMEKYRSIDGQGNMVPYARDDLYQGDMEKVGQILDGTFNSGVFIMDLGKMREMNYSESDYLEFIRDIYRRYEGKKLCFRFIDQSLLSAFFCGRIQYYGLDGRTDPWYRPFNFCMSYFSDGCGELGYSPTILHFTGSNIPKPWQVDFADLPEGWGTGPVRTLASLDPRLRPYYEQWHAYLKRAEAKWKEMDSVAAC